MTNLVNNGFFDPFAALVPSAQADRLASILGPVLVAHNPRMEYKQPFMAFYAQPDYDIPFRHLRQRDRLAYCVCHMTNSDNMLRMSVHLLEMKASDNTTILHAS
jgi:hypothetical protein